MKLRIHLPEDPEELKKIKTVQFSGTSVLEVMTELSIHLRLQQYFTYHWNYLTTKVITKGSNDSE